MTDREAIALAQAGNQRGFTELYERHKVKVYAICRRMVKSHEEAEDLRQETFAKAFAKLGSFRGDAAFSTWLYRIAVNMVLMYLRKVALQTVSLDDYEPQFGEGSGWRHSLAQDDERLSTVGDRLALMRAVAELAPGYRTIFLLHEIHGFGHREIAALLHCSIGNSKSQLAKARNSLRDMNLTRSAITARIHRARMALREKL